MVGESIELVSDCSNCFGLCCVALPFAKSSDFAVDKAGGTPCRNLRGDFRCGIHTDLRGRGFTGCTVYDCFGAGQQVSQVTFAGRDWRTGPDVARPMFDVFPVMRQLHELLWYLDESLRRPVAGDLVPELSRLQEETAALAGADAATLVALDVPAHRERVNTLLLAVSERVRASAPGRPRSHRGADLMGAKLAGKDLRGANLRGAWLIGADLRRTDLRCADVIGADLRGADLSGADLSEALFLTQFQVNAARGDARTVLPATLSRPAHWR
ncbi:pentapeptide repeat-containing protein [Prescottella subtropica]|uniref:pentapeptide repeat-containing protein n=1 Tax=Prescottella subtropica TaxID=2545757 RepID=UPI0010F9E83B|nr:pentapeptide repeat-containing protein [Prescottella subtropica]